MKKRETPPEGDCKKHCCSGKCNKKGMCSKPKTPTLLADPNKVVEPVKDLDSGENGASGEETPWVTDELL